MDLNERKTPLIKFRDKPKMHFLINVDRNVNALENFSNTDNTSQMSVALGPVLDTLFMCNFLTPVLKK
jgi:hypothetical protein